MMLKSVLLPVPPMAAFELFTQRASEWWPRDRRHTADSASEIMLLQTGRFYERAGDGQEVELGRVRAWDAPHHILLDFFPATGPDHPTEVEITFAACEDGTRVTVSHRPKRESEALWVERAAGYERSWDGVLTALRAAA